MTYREGDFVYFDGDTARLAYEVIRVDDLEPGRGQLLVLRDPFDRSTYKAESRAVVPATPPAAHRRPLAHGEILSPTDRRNLEVPR